MNEQVAKIIETLTFVHEKPGLWVGVDMDKSIVHFIHGLSLSCALFDVNLGDKHLNSRIDDDIFKEVVLERGWEYSAEPVYHQMQTQGYEPKRIAQEVVAIEIEVSKRRYKLDVT